MNLNNKIALVTGASEGIGRACVDALYKRGAKLVLAALPGPECDSLQAAGHVVVPGDLTDPAVRERFLDSALEKYGRVDILINNAGVGLYASPTRIPLDLARRLFEINVFVPLALSQSVALLMKKRGGGVIVNMGSVGGFVSLPWAAIYCASKFTLHALNDSLRRELQGQGVHVMKVCPGIVRTDFRKHVLAGSAPKRVDGIDRTVSADQVAEAVASGIEKGRSTVYVPSIGRLFRALDFVAPSVMDWYLRTKA